MTTINQLTSVDEVQVSDLLPIFSQDNGDARKVSLGTLSTFMQEQITESDGAMTQYFAPNASGFSVTVTPSTDGENVHLLMTPTGAFAAGTVTLPVATSSVQGQEVLVTSTQAVTTLTVGANGATAVNGAPTTLAANGFFKLRFDQPSLSWYRVG